MKQLLLKTIACAALLLPFSQAEAKTYGGFKPGKTFTFTVEEKITAQTKGFSTVAKKVPVPSSVPNYNKGQKIKFKIGPKGQLIGPKKLSIPYKDDGGTANVYNFYKTGKNPMTNTGTVYKNLKNKPHGVALNFVRVTGVGFNMKTTVVTYTLR